MWIWGLAAILALGWPDRITGPLHGVPLDDAAGVIVVALVVPVLWFLHGRFLLTRTARAAILVLLAWKLFSSIALVQDGFCVRVTPLRPYAKDAADIPHSWDVRADWRSPHPSCSAVMTGPYTEITKFPVWFFNLPPPNDNLPAPEDRPPMARIRMTVEGFLYTRAPGQLDIATSRDVDATMYVDGASVGSAALAAGLHSVVIDAAMTGDGWALLPRFNRADLWSSAIATTRRPTRIDVLVRPWGKWITVLLAGGFVLLWAFAATRSIVREISIDVRRLGNLRGVLLIVGLPWLLYVVGRGAPLVGRLTLYSAGDDFWQFQRYAYRIVMQGYWLEGGSPTFWFQPLYRWTAGGLHLVFGDSSIGELVSDGWCVLIGAMAAFRITKPFAGFWCGLTAAALSIVVFQMSAAHTWLGAGLGEISAMGLLYLAVLVVCEHPDSTAAALTAGVFATLAFYTRLNHLIAAGAVALFAVPATVAAGDLFFIRRWIADVRWRSALLLVAVLGFGVLLFAWRTWHYTGVFSIFYGTQREMLSTIQPQLTWTAILRRMFSSVMMVLTIADPPRFQLTSLPLIVGTAAALLCVAGVPRLRSMPLNLVLFGLLAISGALFARGSAYLGRFSVHAIPVGCALTACAIAAVTGLSPGKKAPLSPTPVAGLGGA